MKKNLTKREILELDAQFEQAIAQTKNVPFKVVYALSVNSKTIREAAEIIKKTLEPTKEFIEYNEKRIELAKSLADKDEVGEPILIGEENNKRFQMIEHLEEFNTKLNELIAEYKEAIDNYNFSHSEENINEKIELDLHAVSLQLIENERFDGITANVLSYFVSDSPILSLVK
jgi:hypothetical protein